jgi:hypothetical protein
MSDYGDYRMHITGSGYLANTMEFKIDREKPFFIEKVSLLPSPQYRIIPTAKKLYQITDDTYIIQAASGLMWSGSTMSGRVNHSGSLDHIGGKYFKTNTTILRWEIDKFMLADEYITNYIRTCPQVAWVYELFYCPQVQSILTQ